MKELHQVFDGKRALVTGGLGFIGSHLAERLSILGAEVCVVDAIIEGQGGNRFNLDGLEDRIDIHVANIRDRDALSPLLADRDYVFNLAAYTSHIKSIEEPIEDLEINCRSHLEFLELLKDVNSGCRLVYTGSRCQYGRALYLPIDENHPFNVTDINSAHKATVEMYHLLSSRIYGIPCCLLRLTNVYGPRHQMLHSKQGFLNWFVRVGLDGGEIKIFGEGTQYRDFIYVSDAVEAILQAAAEPACYGDAINIGSGSPVSIREAAEKISGKTGCAFTRVPWPDGYLSIEAGDLYLDTQKIQRLIGWHPLVGFEEGLDRTLDFYREFGDRYWDRSSPAEEDFR